jgi:hypothetical protein
MKIGAIPLPDQSSQSPRINVGILFLFLKSKLQHLTLEFYRALAASFRWEQGTESQLAESLLNLIEAFPAEAELWHASLTGPPSTEWARNISYLT